MANSIRPFIDSTNKSVSNPDDPVVAFVIDRMKDLGYTFVETALEIRVYRPNGELAILAKKQVQGVH